jgi:hypothetical protein
MRCQILAFALLATLLVCDTASAGYLGIAYIGVQFNPGSTALTPSTIAGVVPQDNFNTDGNQNDTISNLKSANGAPTGVSLSYTATSTFTNGASSPGPNGQGDATLLTGEDKTNPGASPPYSTTATYSLTNLAAKNYNLIIYTVDDAPGATEQTNITTGNTSTPTLYSVEQVAGDWNVNPVYVSGQSTTAAGATEGNYIEFFGVSPVGGTIAWDHTLVSGGNAYGAYNGFELVLAVPEPPTWVGVLGVAGIGLIGLAWRRRSAA